VTLNRCRRIAAPLAWLALMLGGGCGIAPKSFNKVADPAPINRARSVSLAAGLPQRKVVPALIDRLEDRDPVVRLAAFEELRTGTGKTFGFVPWAGEAERAAAVARWRAWWKQCQDALARSGRNP
jgi:hypothetical protein